MFKRIPLQGKLLVILSMFVLLSFATVSPAFASAATGSQNPDLTVAASLASNGPNPDQAAVGNTVTYKYSFTNNTTRKLSIQVTLQLVDPSGQTTTSAGSLTLQPGQTVSETGSYTDQASFATGTYSLIASASDANGTSSATATITLI